MFLAISEMAVAIIVTSVSEKPSSRASLCPACRAVTMSSESRTSTTVSVGNVSSFYRSARGRRLRVEQREPLLQVECGVHPVEDQAELHHREGDLGLQTHDD